MKSSGLNFYLILWLTRYHYFARRDSLDSARTGFTSLLLVSSTILSSPESQGYEQGTATVQLSQVSPTREPLVRCLLSLCVLLFLSLQISLIVMCVFTESLKVVFTPRNLPPKKHLISWKPYFPSSLPHCGFEPCSFFIYIISLSFN